MEGEEPCGISEVSTKVPRPISLIDFIPFVVLSNLFEDVFAVFVLEMA